MNVRLNIQVPYMTYFMEKLYLLTEKHVYLAKDLKRNTTLKTHWRAQLLQLTYICAHCYCFCSIATAETSKFQVTVHPVLSIWCKLFLGLQKSAEVPRLPQTSIKRMQLMTQDTKEILEVYCYIQHLLLSTVLGILKVLTTTKPIMPRPLIISIIIFSVPYKCKVNKFLCQIMLSRVSQIYLNFFLYNIHDVQDEERDKKMQLHGTECLFEFAKLKKYTQFPERD